MAKRRKEKRRPVDGSPSPNQAGLPRRRRRVWVWGICLLVVVAAIGWGLWRWRSRSGQLDFEPYGRVRMVREAPGGLTLYLVPMQHYYAPQTRTGPEENAEQLPTLAPIQTEIYRIIQRLHEQGRLDLVFGEGLMGGEFHFNILNRGWSQADYDAHAAKADDDAFLQNFFRANPKEAGYTVYELFHPEMVTWGSDDAEIHQRLDDLNAELFDYADRHGTVEPGLGNFMRRYRAEQGRLNRERSARVATAALAKCEELYKAGRLRSQRVAVVMGTRHIPEIIEEVEKLRHDVSLIEIWPRTLPGNPATESQ